MDVVEDVLRERVELPVARVHRLDHLPREGVPVAEPRVDGAHDRGQVCAGVEVHLHDERLHPPLQALVGGEEVPEQLHLVVEAHRPVVHALCAVVALLERRERDLERRLGPLIRHPVVPAPIAADQRAALAEPRLERRARVHLRAAEIHRIARVRAEEGDVVRDVLERGVRVPQQQVEARVNVQLVDDLERALVVREELPAPEPNQRLCRARLDAEEHAEQAHPLQPREELAVDLVGARLDGEGDAPDAAREQRRLEPVEALERQAAVRQQEVVVVEIEDAHAVVVERGHLLGDALGRPHPQARAAVHLVPRGDRAEVAVIRAAARAEHVDDRQPEIAEVRQLARRPRERVEVRELAGGGVAARAAVRVSPHQPLDGAEVLEVRGERQQDRLALADGDGVERRHIAHERLRVERREVPARRDVPRVAERPRALAQLDELERPAREDHRHPGERRARARELRRGAFEVRGAVEHDLRDLVPGVLERASQVPHRQILLELSPDQRDVHWSRPPTATVGGPPGMEVDLAQSPCLKSLWNFTIGGCPPPTPRR